MSELGLPFRKLDDKPKKAEVKEIKKEPAVEEAVTEEPAAEGEELNKENNTNKTKK